MYYFFFKHLQGDTRTLPQNKISLVFVQKYSKEVATRKKINNISYLLAPHNKVLPIISAKHSQKMKFQVHCFN